MATYDDDVVTLDETGITVKSFLLPGKSRRIQYEEIKHVEPIRLGWARGRHRLVGVGPFMPRTFFHWDRKRSAKSDGLSLDLGRWFRIAITPDEPDEVLAFLRDHGRVPVGACEQRR